MIEDSTYECHAVEQQFGFIKGITNMQHIQWELIGAVSIIGLCLIALPLVIRRLIAPTLDVAVAKQSQKTPCSDS